MTGPTYWGYDNSAWRVHTGSGSGRFPYWVGRTRDGKTEYAPTDTGGVRRFKTEQAAQKVANKLQITADFNDAREHARLATHHLIRATDHLKSNDPLLKVVETLSDAYIDLTGRQL